MLAFRKAAAAAVLLSAGVAAQAATLLSEGFESFSSLAAGGWVLLNASTPPGSTNLTSGDAGIFTAQAGSPASYVSANYNNAAPGGNISSWLITPQFSTAFAGTVTFWARSAVDPGFVDTITFGLSNAVSGDFTGGALSAPVTLTGSWTQYTVNFAARGAGSTARFAIAYIGPADTSDYIGIDSVLITNSAPIPEPASGLLLGAGALAVAAAARRRKGRGA